eukprot:TRINITY_DN2568_c0_g1_i1.p1 TRINITY_DN2568_c0_g1~~TRINITY_DN2568_c0_g1_i1.p1  ORF type:complete len:610 (+),score=92.20 TRINITY_DN2568_c0_g1_i1:345-2174(+)
MSVSIANSKSNLQSSSLKKINPSSLSTQSIQDNKSLTKLSNTPKSEILLRPPSLGGLKKSASSRFSEKTSAHLEKLPSFREVSPSHRAELFINKLQQCCVLFDFTDPTADLRSKEIKREALLQSVEYIFSNREPFNEIVYGAVFHMVAVNLFRPLPPRTNPYGVMYDPEEDEPILEAAWPHIQIVYELFLRFIDSPDFNANLAKNYIEHKFVLQLLDLFDSEDPRERDYLKTTLHRIYGKFLQLRGFIRTCIRDLFCTFVYETGRHNGIAEILEVLGSIINGYAIPLKDEHRTFLEKVLLPLHKPKSLGLYQSQLTYCVTQFVDKEPRLAKVVFHRLFRMWPVGSSPKEIMFLNEVEEILNVMDDVSFRDVVVMLFKQVALCFKSEHFQVAERALYLWSNDHIVSLVAENVALALPIIYNILYYNSNHHWHKSIRGLSFSSLKLFMEIDPVLYNKCAQQYKEDEEQKKMRLAFANRPTPASVQKGKTEPSKKVISVSNNNNTTPAPSTNTASSTTTTPSPSEEKPKDGPPIRRKSLLPVDPSTLEALSTHKSLEDVVVSNPTSSVDSHLQGEGEIVDLNAPYSDDEDLNDDYVDDSDDNDGLGSRSSYP